MSAPTASHRPSIASVQPPASAAGGPPVLVAQELGKRFAVSQRPRLLRGRAGRVLAWLGSSAGQAGDEAVEDDELEEELEADDDEGGRGQRGWILRGVNLEIAAGSALGVVGPAGAGKSVLVRVLAGLSPPTEGSVECRGRALPAVDTMIKLMQDSTARRCVILLARLVGVGRSVRSKVPEIFAFAGLTGLEATPRKALGVDELRRLIVATMLHLDGSVLFLDAGLTDTDTGFRARVVKALEERRRRGCAVVVLGREIEPLRHLCDEIVWLEAGTIRARGTPDAVAEEVRRLRRVAQSQELPQPTADCVRFLDFLRVAVGELRAEDALGSATAAALGNGDSRVEWTQLAEAVGYDRDEAYRIVERLAGRGGLAGARVPAAPSIARPTLVRGDRSPTGGRATDGDVRIAFRVDVPGTGTRIRCRLVLVGESDRVVLQQPDWVDAERPGTYRVDVRVPVAALSEGTYRTSVVVDSESDGAQRSAALRDALAIPITASPDTWMEQSEPGDPELEVLDLDEADELEASRAEASADVEWDVRGPRD